MSVGPQISSVPLDQSRQPSRWPLHRWQELPVRWQLLIVFAVITVVATGVAAIGLLIDARSRTLAEMATGVEIAERYVREIKKNLETVEEAQKLPILLGAELRDLRHVRVSIRQKSIPELSERRTELRPSSANKVHDSAAMRAVMRLIGLESRSTLVPIEVDGRHIMDVQITGKPSDEFHEAWAGLETIGAIWLGTNIGMFAMLYIVLGRVLKPLTVVAAGMRQLEVGGMNVRVPAPKARELKEIASAFNHLAATLDIVTRENRQLFEEVIQVQERERRRIAGELHDEVGPCLFGIQGNIASIERVLPDLGEDQSQHIACRIDDLNTITGRLRQLNRSILNRLYPLAAGHISIAELLLKLVADLDNSATGATIQLSTQRLARSYGEEHDLLIYRTVQEGVANALRHAQPSIVSVTLVETSVGDITAPVQPGRALVLRIADDGRGFAPDTAFGFGLKTMRERVRALNGSVSILGRQPSGTILELHVPIEAVSQIELSEKTRTPPA